MTQRVKIGVSSRCTLSSKGNRAGMTRTPRTATSNRVVDTKEGKTISARPNSSRAKASCF